MRGPSIKLARDLVHKMFPRKMIQDLEERHQKEEDREEIKIVVTSLAL